MTTLKFFSFFSFSLLLFVWPNSRSINDSNRNKLMFFGWFYIFSSMARRLKWNLFMLILICVFCWPRNGNQLCKNTKKNQEWKLQFLRVSACFRMSNYGVSTPEKTSKFGEFDLFLIQFQIFLKKFLIILNKVRKFFS